MIGTTLSNRYKLVDELGNGGMAWVYLAEDMLEERRVAIKILYPQLGQDMAFLQRFAQEAKLAMSLAESAPEMHIVRVLDYGSDRETHYLVMEYVEGKDLRQVLDKEGALPWQLALDIARQVSLALEYANQHGIVHRDIKPANIILLPDGAARILDFGVARARTSPTLTYSGFVGSPYYVAPEQAMGRSVDIRADIYSLGIVLYEMLGGQPPFQSETPWIVINHHIATPPPPLEEHCPDLPRPVTRLVHKAIAKRPEDRIQNPTDMMEACEAVLAGLDMPFETTAIEPDTLTPMLAGLYQQAHQAVQAEEWQDAVDLFSQILKFDPRYRDVAEQLAEAGRQARLAALYAAARRALKTGHWAEALAQLDEIMVTAPNYRDAQALQIQARQRHELDQLYRQGVQHFEAEEWSASIRFLAQVQERDPDHARAADLLDTAYAEQSKEKKPAASATARQAPIRPRRRRSVVWAIIAILALALAVESYLFYQAQQPRAIAAVSATNTAETGAADLISTPVSTVPIPPTIGPASAPAQIRPSPTLPPTSTPEAAGTTSIPATAQPISATSALATTAPAATTWPRTPWAHAKDMFTHRPTSTSSVTASPTKAAEPLPSGLIAFPRFDPTRVTYDIYICRVDGSNCRLVAAEASQPDFLPGGTQIVFHSWKSDDKGLILQSLSGQRIWRITNQVEDARPSVDFQGRFYAYHSRQEIDRLPRLYRTHDAEIQPVKREASIVMGQSPCWLPDGRMLYAGCLEDECGIIVMQADGSNPRQVAAGGAETNPEAAPDGRRVVFMSQRDGNWEIYVVNIDGSGLKRLTRDPANDGLPTWSPDGRHIAFVSDRDGAWAVWIMRPDGSDQHRLFRLGGPLDGHVLNAAPHEAHGWVEERISWTPLP
jgi:tRNA A-37 threonylcarbamoyl transferase component Bud32/outer membrane protein assembly factor BamD (BamD/ComL family)